MHPLNMVLLDHTNLPAMHTHTSVKWPFVQDYPGVPVPER